ncbi:MAG: hypothetical protein GKR97_07320 [Rhizobiaceae bacterium]|nr:hypothetical protein [Rhizobiaceae bacterium]
MVLFLVFGMRLSKMALTLGLLFVVFNLGGMVSMFTMADFKEIPLYLAVSLFLGLSSVFWAAAIESDMGRLRVLMRGYVVGAVITSCLGIAGYFSAFPGSGMFTLYDRAMGAFQDPNVFGPFLILPALYLTYGLLYRNIGLAPVRLALLAIILLGLFLSFSRGAWGSMVIAGLCFYTMLLMTEQSQQIRAKLILAGAIGLATVIGMLIIALQFDAVYDMFEQRARVVQDYDGAELGRFARHAIGFQWALENPLGIGPLEFGLILGEDTHNIWVKSLMAYGWLGFFAYVTITVSTLVGGARLVGRIRPWQPYLLCAYATYIGHILLGWVIDIDHWRHVYLLIGIIWGCMALESHHQSVRARQFLNQHLEDRPQAA